MRLVPRLAASSSPSKGIGGWPPRRKSRLCSLRRWVARAWRTSVLKVQSSTGQYQALVKRDPPSDKHNNVHYTTSSDGGGWLTLIIIGTRTSKVNLMKVNTIRGEQDRIRYQSIWKRGERCILIIWAKVAGLVAGLIEYNRKISIEIFITISRLTPVGISLTETYWHR